MKEELMQLGLTENESVVYLALLESGLTTVGNIVKKTKFHRNIVYFNFERLIEKGLVSYIIIKNIKHFQVTEISEFDNYIQKQKQEVMKKEDIARKLLPKIRNKHKIVHNEAIASLHEGVKSVKSVMETIFESSDKKFLLFGSGWGAKDRLGKSYYNNWFLRLTEQKVVGRFLLYNNFRFLEKELNKIHKLRFLSDDFDQPATVMVFDDKVINFIWDEKPVATVIESKSNATAYRKYFEYLWNIAKE